MEEEEEEEEEEEGTNGARSLDKEADEDASRKGAPEPNRPETSVEASPSESEIDMEALDVVALVEEESACEDGSARTRVCTQKSTSADVTGSQGHASSSEPPSAAAEAMNTPPTATNSAVAGPSTTNR